MKVYLCIASLLLMHVSVRSQSCCINGTAVGLNAINGNATTLKKGKWLMDAGWEQRNFRSYDAASVAAHFPLDADTSVSGLSHTTVASLRISYGVTSRLTVSAVLPYVMTVKTTTLHFVNGEKHHEYTSYDNGLADASLSGLYLFSAPLNEHFQAFVMAGLELPTGNSDANQRSFVAGSGSFDPLAGIVLVKRWNRFSLKGNVVYKLTTKGNEGVDHGDLLSHDVSLVYMARKPIACDSVTKHLLSVNIFTDLGGEKIFAQEQDGSTLENTGSYRAFAGLGIQLGIKERFAFPVSIEVPVFEQLDGIQNSSGLRFKTGLSILF